jgi:DNA-binding MarR family transcriptional regulator
MAKYTTTVVKSSNVVLTDLDLGYLGLFLGLRINEIVIERGSEAGLSLRESHGYVIQHLIESERSITELAQRMEVTQQAASKAAAELLRLGVVEIESIDGRTKRVRLSRRGWRIVRFSRRIRRDVERRLVAEIGEKRYEKTKAILIDCLESLGGVERITSRRVRQPR